MRTAVCPLSASLEHLLLGGRPEAEVEALEQHVLECDSCLAELKRLSGANDTLAGLLRDDTETDAASSLAVVALIGKLKALRTISKAAPGPTQACSAQPGSLLTQALTNAYELQAETASLTDFLAPAQAGDELGRLGKYRILKVLGHGGMGVVYQAEDLQLKRTVALKAMLPALAASASARRRFLREAQAMAAVEHDHIVRVYQVDEDRGIPFLAMEFLKGQPLDERLKREAKLPLLEVLRIGREIAEALHAAHATGLIHRDIKPANVWLEERSPSPGQGAGGAARVKLLDFGLVRAVAEESGLTQQGAILGTPAFMPPEQGRGDPVDERGDLFSLGVVLYRLSCGRQPFQGKDTVSTLMEVALHEPLPPRRMDAGLPHEFSELVMRLLQKDPAQRPASASEVVHALQAMQKQLARQPESSAAPTTAAVRAQVPTRFGTRHYLLAAAALVLLTGLVVLAMQAVIRIQTEQGNFVIQTDDPDFRFQVHKDGSVTLEDQKAKRNYVLKVRAHDSKTGAYELEVADAIADLSFKSRVFTIKRGQTVALHAWFERKPQKEHIDDVRIKEITALPAQKQVEAVTAWLKERNRDFQEVITPRIEGGVVTELKFSTHNVTDLTPVRALPGLRSLKCPGTSDKKGLLTNLAPLKGLKLTELDCSNTNVSDLAPLKGMRLTFLDLGNTDVSDLTPLQGMPLTVLFAGCSYISDLGPLREMKLTILHCFRTKVASLAPLKDMKLTALDFHGTQIADLTPLKDMKLAELDCNSTQVSDLAPLKAMKLAGLNCAFTQVSDLAPLKDMRLRSLWCDGTQVSDLMPLKDMRLTGLRIADTQVSDLTPLKDMKLKELWCKGTQVEDLSLLRGMPLEELYCDFKAERDAPILRAIKTLVTINDRPAQEFWKEVVAKKP